tara:strand:- start:521 stop:766 length:246 start_codon:yes stop_codon:yes gene_type:complete
MIGKILEGWKKYFIPDPLTQEEAKVRASICYKCPDKKHGNILAYLKDETIKEIEGYYCGVCRCPLVAKTRSTQDKCPKGNW